MRRAFLVFLLLVRTASRSIVASPMAGCTPPSVLAAVVRRAAVQDDDLDVGGICWLEHINMVCGSRHLALAFYSDLLGFNLDAQDQGRSASFHVNLGRQQLHLGAGDAIGPAQRLSGSLGLAVPSLNTIRKRLPAATAALDGTSFAVLGDSPEVLTLCCPWGNVIHAFEVGAPTPMPEGTPSVHARHAGIDERMCVANEPGIRFVEFKAPSGSTARIGAFYEAIFGAKVMLGTRESLIGPTAPSGTPEEFAVVGAGPSVSLVFSASRDDKYDAATDHLQRGVHIAVYIQQFKHTYQALAQRGLIWTNPRFKRLDTCDTYEEAAAGRQYRFRYVTDLSTGDRLLELEHETRSMRHFQCFKRISYQPK